MNSRQQNTRINWTIFLYSWTWRSPEGDHSEGFITSVYCKKTFRCLFLEYGSFFFIEYKKGLISTLIHRSHTICSNYAKFHDAVSRLMVIRLKTGLMLFSSMNVSISSLINSSSKSCQLSPWRRRKWFSQWCFGQSYSTGEEGTSINSRTQNRLIIAQ